LNTQFFRQTQVAFNDLKSIDANSRTDYEKLNKEADGMGTRDQYLNKMMVYEREDRERRESVSNFDQQYD
jgi:hypothetical protein